MDKTESCYSVISYKLEPNSSTRCSQCQSYHLYVTIQLQYILNIFDVRAILEKKNYDRICIAIVNCPFERSVGGDVFSSP